MPTFDTPNSTQTYDATEQVAVEVFGAAGGDAEGDVSSLEVGESGIGGYVAIRVPAGTSLTFQIASAGGVGDDVGRSPYYDGGAGATSGGVRAGAGGGSTCVIDQSNGGRIAIADGGGGGAKHTSAVGVSGGGGARGGPPGEGNDVDVIGESGEGAGLGGRGGDANDVGGPIGGAGRNGAGEGGGSGVTVVQADEGGGSTGDAYIEITPPPPEVASASQSVTGDDSINVSWDAVSEADYYDLEVSKDGGAWSDYGDVYTNSLAYDANPGTNEHQFRVRPVNVAGSPDWTYTSTKTTDPTSLSATDAGIDSIDISWAGVSDTTEFQIFRSQSSGATEADYSAVATVSGTSFTDTGLSPNTTYYYRVEAVYPGTNSQLSNEAQATPGSSAVTLEGLDASSEGEVVISWSLADGVDDGTVRLFRSTDGSLGSEVASISDLSTTMWTDSSLDDGIQYYYTVRLETGTASVDSSQDSAVTLLPAPENLSATATDVTSIDISWTASHNAGETRVEFKPSDASTWTASGTVARSTETATISGLRNGEEYNIRVIAVTDAAETVDE